MKRILSIALALCMLLALCACGQANDPAPADTGDAAVSEFQPQPKQPKRTI